MAATAAKTGTQVAADVDNTPENIAAGDNMNGIVLDPDNSERQYYRDPYTKLQREIWRPGDGDGDRSTDYYEQIGPPVPVGKRWRFYQLPTGNGPIERDVNEPPRYVVLDDRAANEVHKSDMLKTKLAEWWGHDFGGAGKIRARRPHRGRCAIGDPDAPGQERYAFAPVGNKNERYYFTGEKDYIPIIYRSTGPDITETSATQKRKATTPPPSSPNPKRHGHNQWTQPDLMVKNGAPPFTKNPRRCKPRLNRFLRRDASPESRFENAALNQQERRHVNRDLGAMTSAPPAREGYGDEVQSVLERDYGMGMRPRPSIEMGLTQVGRGNMNESYNIDDLNEDYGSDADEYPSGAQSTYASAPSSPLADQARTKSKVTDNGIETERDSYVSKLESIVGRANTVIEEQTKEIAALKAAYEERCADIGALEAEIAMLRGDEVGDE